MAKKSGVFFVGICKKFIQSPEVKNLYRVKVSDFTRNRKFGFEGLVYCLICLLRQNIQIELNKYIKSIDKSSRADLSNISSSAFVQHRKKLKPEMFYDLNAVVVNEYYNNNDENVDLYKGYRLLAIDGSAITLPVNKNTKQVYGVYNNQNKSNDVVLGRASVLYDLLNDLAIDAKLSPFKTSELDLAITHIQHLQKNDIVIMDRGYPSFKIMYELKKHNADFIIRCKTSFSSITQAFFESDKKEDIVELFPGQKKSFLGLVYNKKSSIKVRLVKIELSSGETEILITSLLNTEEFLYEKFEALYFKRWGIETYYDKFKNIIGVEKFSGTSSQFIQQEFNCAVYLSNMQSILTKDAQAEVEEKYKHRKYEYKINSSLSLCFIREKLISIFTSDDNDEQILNELKTLFIRNVVPIRPGRKFSRNHEKYRHRVKPKQFQNRRTNL